MKVYLEKGNKVTHSIRPYNQTGMGVILSISKSSGKIWVKWEKTTSTLEVHWQLIKLEEPAILLKEIL